VSFTPFPSKPSAEQRSAADRQLVDACLADDPAGRGWEAFVTQFSGLVSHVVAKTAERRQLSLADADRDDLVADVFFEILRNNAAVLKGFAGRSSLAAYVTVVARRVAGRRLRDARGTARPTASLPMEQVAQAKAASASQQIEDREQVTALLEGLDAEEAKIVRLFHIEERSYGEISRLLGIPLGSVGPVLSRARAKMRRQAG
jgi:RNA polymerase sigma-70 factor (ECF subfamily)